MVTRLSKRMDWVAFKDAGKGPQRKLQADAARAQKPAIPVVDYLSGTSPDNSIDLLADFRRGLAETGYVEGRNLAARP